MEDRLNHLMKEYLARQGHAFVSSCDRSGACHASLQSGPAGFVRVLDDTTVMYPQYADGDVILGLEDDGPVALLFVDSFHSGLTLNISGRARIIAHAAVEAFAPLLRRMAGIEQIVDVVDGDRVTPARWVLMSIVAARMDGPTPMSTLADSSEGEPLQIPAAPEIEEPPVAPYAGDHDELSYLLPAAWQDA